MVEKGLLLNTREALQKAAVNAAERGAQKGLEALADQALPLLSHFVELFHVNSAHTGYDLSRLALSESG
jgi:hypothetical protein